MRTFLAVAAIAILTSLHVIAAPASPVIPPTCTWLGAGSDAKWSTAANWDNCGGAHPVPTGGDILAFPSSAGNKTNTNDIVGLTVTQLQFNGYNYVINGNAISLTNGIATNLGAGNAGDTVPFFDNNITLSGPQTFTASGFQGVFLRGSLNLNGNLLTVTGAGPTGLTGVVSGAGGISTSSHELFLFGNNTYTGVTNITAGVVQAGASNAFGAIGAGNDTIVAPGAGILLDSETPTIINEPLTIGGTPSSMIEMNAGNVTHTWAGAITLLGSTELFNFNDGATLVLSGLISGSGPLFRDGTGGIVVLSNNNTYTGQTRADQGTLLVNGVQPSSAAAVNGGTLGGVGTVGALSATGGVVSPGQSPGILNSGSVSWTSAVTFAIEINGTTPGTQYDQLNVTGTVDLGNAHLTGTVGGAVFPGQSVTIVNNDGVDAIVNTFFGLPQGSSVILSGQTYIVSYTGGTGNDVVLTATITVPAMPRAVWLVLGAALLFAAAWTLRRRLAA